MAAERVVVEWIGRGPAPFRIRKAGFEFIVDEPVERGGTNAAPNPLAYFLAGAASCWANHLASLAIVERVSLSGLTLAAIAHFDRVFADGAFRDITYDVKITTDEAVERVVQLVERADVMCFASNTLANAGVTLTTKVTVNGVAVATFVRENGAGSRH